MAVKIIEEKPDPAIARRVVCRWCGVTLEYLPIDINYRHGTDYSGGADGDESIQCANPACRKKIILRSW